MATFNPLKLICATAALTLSLTTAHALEKITLQIAWKAQADFGGFYQAREKGFYRDCGVDITIRPGGPGIDTAQLLVGGAVEAAISSHIDAVLHMNAAGFPARAVSASFQRFHSILMAHEDSGINSFEDMRGKPIMVSQGNRATWWAFLRAKYGFSDSQLRSYTGQIGPWLADKSAIQQGVVTSEPYLVEKVAGVKPKIFLLADAGYGTYSLLIVVSQKVIDERPKVVQCLVEASNRGYADYHRDPSVAFAVLQKENPENTPELMAYTVETHKKYKIVQNEDTAKLGVGAMTDARWKAHYDFLVDNGIFKSKIDYRQAYTLRFLENSKKY